MLGSDISPWILLIAASATVASFAQVLLKKAAQEPHENFIKEYLNFKVIAGYGLMFVGMGLSMFAYRMGVDYKNGPVMESIANIWVVILSYIFFREGITKNKVIGNALIILGIVFFYMNWAGIAPSLEFMNTDLRVLIFGGR